MARMTKGEAREIVSQVNGRTTDFHRLRSGQVEDVLGFADSRGYRAPRYANGSRARCFWLYVCRTAESERRS